MPRATAAGENEASTRSSPTVGLTAVELPRATAPDARNAANPATSASGKRRIFIEGPPKGDGLPAGLRGHPLKARRPVSGTALLERKELDPAADVQADAGHVGGEIGAQEGDRVRNVLRLARPAQRRALDHSLVHLRVAEREGLGGDDPGDDGVDGDPVASALECERLGQSEQPGFRRRVARLSEAAERPG